MIIERTHYYAKPGQAAEVLAARRAACAVRRELGLLVGAVRARVDGEGPDVTWECEFSTRAQHEEDLAARGASPEFAAARRVMDALLNRFERTVEESVRPLSEHWAGDRDLDGLEVVPREVGFHSGQNELVGYLYQPPGDGPFPCMITNHGSGINRGSTDVSRPANAALLASWGIASFLPHRRGYGNSSGTPWQEEVTGEPGSTAWSTQLAERLDRESEDVVAALGALDQEPAIDTRHVGVIGSSFGGTTTLLAAARSDRFRCAVDFAGAAIVWERAPDLRRLMLAAAGRLSRPVMFIQAATDYCLKPTLELSASLAQKDLIVESRIYPAWGVNTDEGHLFESRGQQVWARDVRRFLERWL